jgi:hypothetical protein
MPLSIRNSETVALARDVAARTGRTVTRTIHEALEKEKAALSMTSSLRPETAAFLKEWHAQIQARGTCNRIVDKAFFDSLYDE